jgi:hypothetical protein
MKKKPSPCWQDALNNGKLRPSSESVSSIILYWGALQLKKPHEKNTMNFEYDSGDKKLM